MAVPAALDERAEVTTDTEVATVSAPRAALFRLVLLGVLLLALVASLVWIPVLLAHRQVTVLGHEFGTDDAATVQADREAAMAVTQQFVLRVNTYGPDLLDSQGQMPAYRSRVKQVITPKFAVSFDKSVSVAEQSVKAYGLDRTCAVFATGVEVIDSDSAQVLVAGSISQTVLNGKGKRVSAGEPSPFRLRVSLDKIDGAWLVDDYQPVTGA
jgi:Mce-associated membrane protein